MKAPICCSSSSKWDVSKSWSSYWRLPVEISYRSHHLSKPLHRGARNWGREVGHRSSGVSASELMQELIYQVLWNWVVGSIGWISRWANCTLKSSSQHVTDYRRRHLGWRITLYNMLLPLIDLVWAVPWFSFLACFQCSTRSSTHSAWQPSYHGGYGNGFECKRIECFVSWQLQHSVLSEATARFMVAWKYYHVQLYW